MTGPSHDERVARARTERLAAQVRDLQEQNRRLRRELEAVRSSETFRVGARILAGPRWLKQQLEKWRRRRRSMRPAPTRRSVGRRPPMITAPVAPIQPRPDVAQDRAYRRFTERAWDDGAIVFRVSTLDLEAGRGDLYVAIGLGRALVARGHDVGLVADDGPWKATPSTLVVMAAAVDEPTDLLGLHDSVLRVAWVRNNVDAWLEDPCLRLYDVVMASSGTTARRLERALGRDVPVLPIGVDLDLFGPGSVSPSPAIVSTMSQFSRDRPRLLFQLLEQAQVETPLRLFGILNGLPHGLQAHDGGQVPYSAMPDVYGQSTIVLDEPQSRNRAGGLNARVFEALAVGSLPLTRPTPALAEMGLQDLPTYTDATSLEQQLRRWATGPERDALVSRLQEVIRRDHSYERRAETLLSVLGTATRTAHPVLGFHPDYRVTNPFQDLLYRDARTHIAIVPVAGPGSLVSQAREGTPTCFHLHWTATILGGASSRRDAARRADRFLADLDEFLGAGGRLLWTLHNVLPHECPFPEEERRLRTAIAARAHRIHVLGPATLEAVGDTYDVPQDRVAHVGHGSFLGVYGDLTTEADARTELGIPLDERVLLVFGQVRPYKGLDQLLEAWSEHRPPRTRLLVVGSVGRDAASRDLARRLETAPDVATHLEAVPDVEVQRYLRAADVVLLAHTTALNSGVVHLASAFGRPVVAPDVGNLRSHTSPEARLLYSPGSTGLRDVLDRVHELDGPSPRRAAHAFAAAYTAADMSCAFTDLARAVLQDVDGAQRS